MTCASLSLHGDGGLLPRLLFYIDGHSVRYMVVLRHVLRYAHAIAFVDDAQSLRTIGCSRCSREVVVLPTGAMG